MQSSGEAIAVQGLLFMPEALGFIPAPHTFKMDAEAKIYNSEPF